MFAFFGLNLFPNYEHALKSPYNLLQMLQNMQIPLSLDSLSSDRGGNLKNAINQIIIQNNGRTGFSEQQQKMSITDQSEAFGTLDKSTVPFEFNCGT